jgi:type VI protein secretion system component VasK
MMQRMIETVAIALIVSVIAPYIMARLLGKQRAAEAEATAKVRAADRQADWDREDKVAARVEKVATDAAAAQEANSSTLHDIHTLVNSDMTAARTAELTATRLLILALKRLPPKDADTRDAIDTAEKRVDELQQILADRLVAQRKVESDAAMAAAAKSAEPIT